MYCGKFILFVNFKKFKDGLDLDVSKYNLEKLWNLKMGMNFF